MDIPFLGNLFSATSDTITSTEIVIFITPHIVSGEESHTGVLGSIKPFKSYDDGVEDMRKVEKK